MKRGRSTGNATKDEAAWIRATKRGGCQCCIARGYKPDTEDEAPDVEAHHLLEGGIRRGHFYTVGLCLWHHKGRLIVAGWNHGTHRRLLGPSLAEGSGPFHAAFGSDDFLLRRQIETNRAALPNFRHPADLAEAA